MLAEGNTTFYKIENGKNLCYDVASQRYEVIAGSESFIILSDLAEKTVWKNSACNLYDMGDDVVGLEWNTKMGSIGSEVIEAINKSISIAEEKYKGLVIANEGAQFSAGANVGMIFMLAAEQEYDELDLAIRMFQNTMMRVRYSCYSGCSCSAWINTWRSLRNEFARDKVQAAAESYIGLVELGVGLIPGGGGTKEFTLSAADEMHIR